jgi:hypothetical protein
MFDELRHPATGNQDEGIRFSDADGRRWSVRKGDEETVPGSRDVRCLVFTRRLPFDERGTTRPAGVGCRNGRAAAGAVIS